ncbi:hypothetical protein F3X94_23485 [Raoultella planticola]|uniref:hypothetical protein n=1 Tax=Raoultella planticola TaxID=575 RepID=UPI001239AB02|nr:hypothetical protein [Raoultella planticola]QEU44079.1 hypothetical protein F3X94_23485 [Raoultella planticola]
MLKAIVTILQILVGLYCLGHVIRQNPKFDAFLLVVENGYGGINNKLKDARLYDGICTLRLMYGFIGFLAFLLIFLTPYLTSAPQPYLLICGACFIISIIGWGSISWCLQHNEILLDNILFLSIFLLSPFLMAFLEERTNTPLLWYPLESIFIMLHSMNIDIDPPRNIFIQACIFSATLVFFMFVQYLFNWLISIPVLLLTIFIVLLTSSFAKIVNLFFPKNAFAGLMAILFVMLIVIQNYLL